MGQNRAPTGSLPMCLGKLLVAIDLAFSAAFLVPRAFAQQSQAECVLPAQPPMSNVGDDTTIYYDPDGLIVHRSPDGRCDGGDTAQREGWYWLGVWIRQHTPGLPPWRPERKLNFDEVLALLEPNHDGVFYRHPKLAPWNNPYSKEWGTSRDQLVPLIAAMGVWGKAAQLRRLWEALPVDVQGKHAFNGNWRNALGQDGWNCLEIKNVSCGGTLDCSLREDTRDCSPQVDNRDCSAGEDRRNCSQPHDARSCSVCLIHNPWGGCVLYGNDPLCEGAKAAQNKIYDGNKAACELAKATQNTGYAAGKASCEASKAAQNEIYKANMAPCEAAKGAQNAAYVHLKLSCETAKSGGKYACEAYKATAQAACLMSNVFNGDLFGPAEINLFMRALKHNPLLPDPYFIIPSISSVPRMVLGGMAGETFLLAGTHIRIGASYNPDDVGDDLNLIVELLISKLRFPSAVSANAVHEYAVQRQHSYGSYLEAYSAHYGADCTDQANRINTGVAQGWKPEVSAVYGAARWYHRACSGGNPGLAALYGPILAYYIR
jgi:hypothetical protein